MDPEERMSATKNKLECFLHGSIIPQIEYFAGFIG